MSEPVNSRRKGRYKTKLKKVHAPIDQTIKPSLHARNVHKQGYNFDLLKTALPELASALIVTPAGHKSIDFAKAESVKLLNQALLKHHYRIDFWDLPDNYLCPAIPGRVDYIHYLADLLAPLNKSVPPKGKSIKALDIGTGANGVYPMVGHCSYGWQFTASDIDPISVKTAQLFFETNKVLKGNIHCRLQKVSTQYFKGIIQDNEHYDVTLCNPPFHASSEEAAKGSLRKERNLAANKFKKGHVDSSVGKKGAKQTEKASARLNFAGQSSELWCQGGELQFLCNMIKESKQFSEQCLWFTSLVSKSKNLKLLQHELNKQGVAGMQVIDMWQGQKKTRVLAWTFLTPKQQQLWAEFYWR